MHRRITQNFVRDWQFFFLSCARYVALSGKTMGHLVTIFDQSIDFNHKPFLCQTDRERIAG